MPGPRHPATPRRVRARRRPPAAVELVARHAFAGPEEDRVAHGDGVAIAEGQGGAEVAGDVEDAAHRVPVQLGAQVQQARAFGVDRTTRRGMRTEVGAQEFVGGQRLGVFLREATADHDAARIRGQPIDERVEHDDARTGGGQHLGVLGVAEGERRSPGDGDDRRLGRRGTAMGRNGFRRRPRRRIGHRSCAGGGHDGRQVEGAAQVCGHRVHRRDRVGIAFGSRDQAKVAGGHGQRRVTTQHAENRQSDPGGGLSQHHFVTGRADPVEDDARDRHRGVIGQESVQHRGQ